MSLVDSARLPGRDHGGSDRANATAFQIFDYDCFDPKQYSTRTKDREYEARGDHLHVLELVGSDVIGVNIGQKEYGFIPVREGDTIKGEFTRFSVRDFARRAAIQTRGSGTSDGGVRARFLVSSGERLIRRFNPQGFTPGFPVWQGVAAATGTDVFQGIPNAHSNATNNGDPTPQGNPGQFGGKLYLKNTSAVDIFLYWGVPGSFEASGAALPWSRACSWVIPAGGREEMVLDSGMRRMLLSGTANPVVHSICVASLAGAATFQCMLTRYPQNLTAPENQMPDDAIFVP